MVVVVPRTFLVRNAILNTIKTVNAYTNIAKGTRDPRVEFISQVLHKSASLRRGVRSDAQLSCTETRFQKCSRNGKNGFKQPMLTKSTAYIVIPSKKIKRNAQKSTSLILLCKSAPFLRNDHK